LLHFNSENDIFEDLVQRMTCMQAAICVWRAIVQKKRGVGGTITRLPLVEVIGASLDILFAKLNRRPRSVRFHDI
jgi:hypothetical protein